VVAEGGKTFAKTRQWGFFATCPHVDKPARRCRRYATILLDSTAFSLPSEASPVGLECASSLSKLTVRGTGLRLRPCLVHYRSHRWQPLRALADDDEEAECPEGLVIYRLHRARERNGSLIKKKKAQARKAGRPLSVRGVRI
jgi:hypothetical protein